MGCCGGKLRDETDLIVQAELNQDKHAERKVKKLLLLGAGGSGKTTLFKQLQNIHGGGFTPLDRRTYVMKIHEQIIESIKLMVDRCNDFVNAGDLKFQLSDSSISSVRVIDKLPNGTIITSDIAIHVKNLWEDQAIKEAFNLRNKICIPDSTKHYLDNLDRITASEYVPDDHDLLLVRYRTTGMTEKEFVINGTRVRIVDVGGQRNERRKWINHFDGVTSVIFVAALSCYDEVPFEDEEGNSMLESLQVFSDQITSPVFLEKPFILFLNKSDLFEEKVKHVSLKVCFGDVYTGDNSYNDGISFIRKQFESRNNNENREIYVHITCATDTESIQKVFKDIQSIIVSDSLLAAGLV